jgi:hypothetical protein
MALLPRAPPAGPFSDIGRGDGAGCGGGVNGFVPGGDEAGSGCRFQDAGQGCVRRFGLV